MVVGRGAIGALYVRATGVTAHVAAARALGASAVSAMTPLVEKLKALTDLSRGISATAGVFRCGGTRQVSPVQAELHLELRAKDQDGAVWLVTEAKRISSVPPADDRVKITIEGGFYRPPFPNSAGTRRLYGIAQQLGVNWAWWWTNRLARRMRWQFRGGAGCADLGWVGDDLPRILQPARTRGTGQHRCAYAAVRQVDPGDWPGGKRLKAHQRFRRFPAGGVVVLQPATPGSSRQTISVPSRLARQPGTSPPIRRPAPCKAAPNWSTPSWCCRHRLAGR